MSSYAGEFGLWLYIDVNSRINQVMSIHPSHFRSAVSIKIRREYLRAFDISIIVT